MEKPSSRKFMKHYILIIVLIVLLNIAAGVGIYYYNQYMSVNNLLKNSNVAVDKQTKELVASVGKLMMLPKNEDPVVASVTDETKLKQQQFFENAKNGDKLLIYLKAKKAILYDPRLNMIVDVGPVNANDTQVPSQNQPIPNGITSTPTKYQTQVVTPTLAPRLSPTITQ